MSRKLFRSARRAVTLTSAVALGAVALAACGSGSTSTAAAPGDLSAQTLKVGLFDKSVQALFEASGALEGVPYKIDWVVNPAFGEADGLFPAFASNSIQVAMNGSLPASTAIYGKYPFKIVSASKSIPDPKVVSSALITPTGSDIKTVADLKGKTVAVAKNSGSQYYLDAFIEAAGLKLSDVNFKFVDPQNAGAAFASGTLDAWMTYGSYSGQFLSAGKARVVIDVNGNDADGNPTGIKAPDFHFFWFVPDDVLNSTTQEPVIKDFIGRTSKFVNWAYDNQTEAAQVVAKVNDVSETSAAGTAHLFHNQQLLIDDASIAALQKTADESYEFGILPGKIDVKPYFDDRYNSVVTPRATP